MKLLAIGSRRSVSVESLQAATPSLQRRLDNRTHLLRSAIAHDTTTYPREVKTYYTQNSLTVLRFVALSILLVIKALCMAHQC